MGSDPTYVHVYFLPTCEKLQSNVIGGSLMRNLIYLNLFNAVFAFLTSMGQTHRIIRVIKKSNKRNFVFLIILAIFAAVTSIVQSNIIIRKITNKLS
jgi:hypothetical protein